MFKILTRTLASSPYPFSLANVLKASKIGDFIEVKGWIKSLRNQKDNVFIDLSDGSTHEKLQILIPKNLKPDNLSTGASIIATGNLNLSPKNQLELAANKLEICGECVVSEGYPFAPRKQYNSDYVRQYLHLRPRTNKFGALLRVRNAATLAFHNYLNSEGFINISTPILTSNDCEGAGEVFKVVPESEVVIKAMIKPRQDKTEAYFNRKTYLTVSGQLHLEAAAHGLSKVYTFGPTFRAENSKSRLHLSEFYMLEAELAFVNQLEEIMNLIEKLLKNVTKTVLDQSGGDVRTCREIETNPELWVDKQFPILTYEEATDILEAHEKFQDFNKDEGLSKEHELFLVEHCGNVPVFVINWPKKMKPFYMRECADNPDLVAALDLLGPNTGEIVGGSLREDNYARLKDKLPEGNSYLDWYLDLRKFGGAPTGGFGLGFERFLQLILGITNIKDTIPFPRWPHNCKL